MRPPVRTQSYLIVFACLTALLLMAHTPWLSTPYFWDEIGQFVPASLDLFQTGAWVPHSTLPNVHPPGVMAYLAGFWTIFGYSIEHTRIAMLLIAAFALLTAFLLAIELGRGAPGTPAFTALALLAISPLFFSQSMMALLDMPAMGLTALALLLFLQNRFVWCTAICVLLVLVKETGIVAPLVFGAWLLFERRIRTAVIFILPALALAAWLLLLRNATGHWLGNAEFAEFNVWYPLHPVRLVLALLRRVYYVFVSTGHFIGTAALIYAWKRMPALHDRAWRVAFTFAGVHTLAVCVTGGAVLERYLLPVLPILYAAFAIAFFSLPAMWRVKAPMALAALLLAANWIFPPYPFPFENNLAWTSFATLEQASVGPLDVLPHASVATAFPLSDALRRTEFGYVQRPRRVRQVASFRQSDLIRLQADPPDCLIVFTQTWDPLHLLADLKLGQFLHRFYGYEREATVPEIERLLTMRESRSWRSRGIEFALLVR